MDLIGLRRLFGRRVDASSLALFRIVFGAVMMWDTARKLPKYKGMYSPDFFHFKYALFTWVEPLPENWMVGG